VTASPIIEIVSERTVLVAGTPTHELVLTAFPAPELVLSVPGVQGVPGPTGAIGPTGPQGPAGPPGGAQQQVTTFAFPLQVWQVPHTIPITPNVIATDTSGGLIEGDVSYPTPTTVRVEWAYPMAGQLVLTS
jgi:hypothetical protein